MKKVKPIYSTPLSIAVNAGRTCWDSHSRGGCYSSPTDDIVCADKAFLDRILNKNKHRSVAEHIRVVFDTDDNGILDDFMCNPYSYVVGNRVSTNLRVLLERDYRYLTEAFPQFEFLFEGYDEEVKTLDASGLIMRETPIKDKVTLRHYFNDDKNPYVSSFNFEISGISRSCLAELSRHRTASFSVKSTRYTLTKDLKGEQEFNEMDFTRASKYIVLTGEPLVDMMSVRALENIRRLVVVGTPNDILKYAMPECYKVDLFFTINDFGLYNFLKLRTSNAALKEIRELALDMYKVLPEEVKSRMPIV